MVGKIHVKENASDILNNLEKTPEINRKLEYPASTTNGKGGKDSDKEASFRDYLDVQNGQGGGS